MKPEVKDLFLLPVRLLSCSKAHSGIRYCIEKPLFRSSCGLSDIVQLLMRLGKFSYFLVDIYPKYCLSNLDVFQLKRNEILHYSNISVLIGNQQIPSAEHPTCNNGLIQTVL